MLRNSLMLLSLLAGLTVCAEAPGQTPPAGTGGASTIILNTAKDRSDRDAATIWRYYETWQSDIATVDGKLVNVNIYDAREKADGGWRIKEPKKVMGSAWPAEGWQKPDFDDSDWVRSAGPFPNMWRSLALVCLRGKFQAPNPEQVTEITLSVKFQGGVVAYLNGKEVGRSSMPEGKIEPTTPAKEYPTSAFVDARNNPIVQVTSGGRILATGGKIANVPYEHKDADTLARFQSRARTMELKIQPGMLQKGLNVLSLEIHRSPADPLMYTTQDLTPGNRPNLSRCWNRAAIEDVSLTMTGPAGAVVPNVSRPDGLQVWTEEALSPLNPMRYADPDGKLTPIQLCGLKNGTYAGQALVGSRGAIKGLKATAGELKSGQNTIPATAIQIAYGSASYDGLEPEAPAEAGAVVRVWVSVKVPKDAPAGKYAGAVTIEAAGQKPVAVPIEMKVVGNWVLPEPRDFTTFVGVQESSDSVAMQYNVPLWSEEHWKHLDAVYRLLAQVGVKDVYLPLIAKTHLANSESLVRWIPQADGTYKHDLSVLERYLDTAVKNLGKPPVVCLYLHDYGYRIEQNKYLAGDSDHAGGLVNIKPTVTSIDPATGKLGEFQPPDWGTPEARTFWKPVIDDVRALLAKRGLEKSMMFGLGANNWARRECVDDLKALYPDVPWVNRTHYFAPNVSDGKTSQTIGLASIVSGAVSVCYDPEEKLNIGWKTPKLNINFPRSDNVEGAVFGEYMATYRLCGEGVLLAGGSKWNNLPSSHGLGHIGADFWPVMKDPRGGPSRMMASRYVTWHSLSLEDVVPSILAPGAKGPVGTVRLQLMREALQDAEARVLVQNALLEPDQTAKLGADLAKRCSSVCLDRTQVLRYYSKFAQPAVNSDYARMFSQHQWDALSERLYQAAGEVAQATGKK